jgi:hypothetical protein
MFTKDWLPLYLPSNFCCPFSDKTTKNCDVNSRLTAREILDSFCTACRQTTESKVTFFNLWFKVCLNHFSKMHFYRTWYSSIFKQKHCLHNKKTVNITEIFVSLFVIHWPTQRSSISESKHDSAFVFISILSHSIKTLKTFIGNRRIMNYTVEKERAPFKSAAAGWIYGNDGCFMTCNSNVLG